MAAIKTQLQIELHIIYIHRKEISKISGINRKIKVLYGESEVDRVTTTTIAIWNKGRKPLKREDVPQNDPLIISKFQFILSIL